MQRVRIYAHSLDMATTTHLRTCLIIPLCRKTLTGVGTWYRDAATLFLSGRRAFLIPSCACIVVQPRSSQSCACLVGTPSQPMVSSCLWCFKITRAPAGPGSSRLRLQDEIRTSPRLQAPAFCLRCFPTLGPNALLPCPWCILYAKPEQMHNDSILTASAAAAAAADRDSILRYATAESWGVC